MSRVRHPTPSRRPSSPAPIKRSATQPLTSPLKATPTISTRTTTTTTTTTAVATTITATIRPSTRQSATPTATPTRPHTIKANWRHRRPAITQHPTHTTTTISIITSNSSSNSIRPARRLWTRRRRPASCQRTSTSSRLLLPAIPLPRLRIRPCHHAPRHRACFSPGLSPLFTPTIRFSTTATNTWSPPPPPPLCQLSQLLNTPTRLNTPGISNMSRPTC